MHWGLAVPRAVGAAAVLALVVGAATGAADAATQQSKLTADDAVDSARFGGAVAISGDSAVIGAFAKGSAYVFTRTGTSWTQQASLVATVPVPGDQFGNAVAIADDTAVVGAYQDEAAYVFTRSGTTWTQQAKLAASDPSDTNSFGASVAIAGDTAVVGAFGNGSLRGAAYVFTRTGTVWTEQAKLTADDGAMFDSLGFAVSIAGETVVASAQSENLDQGAVYVFTRTGTAWTQQAKLKAADAATAGTSDFGSSTALEGDTVVVGANSQNSHRGAAYVFTRAGTTWTQQTKLVPPDPANNDWFGNTIAVAGDAVVVGAYAKSATVGAAYSFTRTGTAWSGGTKFLPEDSATSDFFGRAVALSGTTAVVGADFKMSGQGAAYVFDVDTAPPPITSFFLPQEVKAKVSSKSAAKSTVTADGIFDTGPDAPDFASAATLDVGGLHFDIPGLTPAGKGFTFAGNGVTFTITPNPYGSSRAKFKLNYKGDFTGKVALNGPLDMYFENAVADGGCTVILAKGAFALGKVGGALVQPNLFIVRARADLSAGGDDDDLSVVVGLATGGTTPPAASDLTFEFATTLSATILAGEFVRKGATDTFNGNRNGITKVVVDYPRGQITITGKGLALGNFVQGGNPVLLTVGLGGDVRAVLVRMGRIGNTMKY